MFSERENKWVAHHKMVSCNKLSITTLMARSQAILYSIRAWSPSACIVLLLVSSYILNRENEMMCTVCTDAAANSRKDIRILAQLLWLPMQDLHHPR